MKTGDRIPLLTVKLFKVFTADNDERVTIMVYVWVVVPSCAVTTVVMVLVPVLSDIDWLAVPDVTAIPFTVTVAVASVSVGVILILLVVLITLSVYDVMPLLNEGLNVPLLIASPVSVATDEAARFTVRVYVCLVIPS